MTTWFTSDLHLGHANIIRYSDRPFPDVEAMDDALVARWNAVVAPDDVVWVLGDVALGRIADSLARFGELTGRKLLLAGNHDRCWSGHRKDVNRWIGRYLDAGFAEVHQGSIDLDVAGEPVLLCHFPYRGDSQDQDRHVADRPVDRGRWLLHGHVHERWQQRDRMINVGVDAWDYAPVAEAQLAALIAAGPAERPCPGRAAA